ncbi:MAG: FKBP-type peptidyl-prolyl cis-trans isomerase [Saprospiraceae bacterium]|nr:FKBP-type peptidyl-prolyl cis-trans isomerase [Saprospiraceae bacterium]
MKYLTAIAIMLFCGLQLRAQNLSNSMDSLSYSVGVLVAQNLKQQGLDKVDATKLAEAISDVLAGKELQISKQDANANVQAYMTKRQNMAGQINLEEGEAFLAENGKRPEVTTTASGLQYEVLEAGDGKSPKATDQVTVHYEGTLLDGTVFDSSFERGQPATFGLNQVIGGWTEGVQLMKEGDTFRFFIPSQLAYGARGAGNDIGPNATLIFKVQLIAVK